MSFSCWRRFSPKLPRFGDLGVGLANMAITPSNMNENSSKSYQNDQNNVGQILTKPYEDLMNIGGTGGHWLPQNMLRWKQILTKILKKFIITRKSEMLFIWIIMFHIWTFLMLIHADSYHPNKNIKHFIGRNVIFSYFHFATVKKTRKSTKKKMFTLICNQDGPLGVPHGVL